MSFEVVSAPEGSTGRGGPAARAAERARLVEALNIEIAAEKLDLPSYPEVAARARKALGSEDIGLEVAARVISAEPALSARLLQLANSAALNASGRRVADLRLALGRIGIHMARSATIAFAMSQLRRAETYKGLEGPLTELWQESAHVAAMCHVVARRFTSVSPETALLAGLLQGIGKLYLLTRAARFPALLSDPETYQPLVAEWHGRLAQAILRNWEISDEIIDAVAHAHLTDRQHGGAIDLADILCVSSVLASFGTAPVDEDSLFLGMPAARRMKLDGKACQKALVESHHEINSLRQALGI